MVTPHQPLFPSLAAMLSSDLSSAWVTSKTSMQSQQKSPFKESIGVGGDVISSYSSLSHGSKSAQNSSRQCSASPQPLGLEGPDARGAERGEMPRKGKSPAEGESAHVP